MSFRPTPSSTFSSVTLAQRSPYHWRISHLRASAPFRFNALLTLFLTIYFTTVTSTAATSISLQHQNPSLLSLQHSHHDENSHPAHLTRRLSETSSSENAESDEDGELEQLLREAHNLVAKNKKEHLNSVQRHASSNKLSASELRFVRDAGLTQGDIDDLESIDADLPPSQRLKRPIRHLPSDARRFSAADDDTDADADSTNAYDQRRRASGDIPRELGGNVGAEGKSLVGRREDDVNALLEDSHRLSSRYNRHHVNDDDSDSDKPGEEKPRRPREPGEPEDAAHLRMEVNRLRADLDAARKTSEKLHTILDKARAAFQRSVSDATKESREEVSEMRSTIEEQKRAFDELLEEKRLISKVLKDEQKTLKQLQERIQHPDLGLWLRDRADRAALLMETPETDAMKYYARKYVAPQVDKLRHRLEVLERRVERTVDHLLPARYGAFVALLLSSALIAFPVFVTMSTVVSLSTRMSLKQYVLLGNVFLAAFVLALCVAGVVLRQDPLQTLYEASESVFIVMQLAAAVMFPLFLCTILATVVNAEDRLDMFVFGCEFVFYLLVGMNYRVKVFRPVMLGQNIDTGAMLYFVYLMDFVSMTMLTVSAARPESSGDAAMGGSRYEERSVSGWDVESASGGTGKDLSVASVGRRLLQRTLDTTPDGKQE